MSRAARPFAAAARAALIATTTIVATALLVSCSDGQVNVRSLASPGWSSFGGNAGNTNFAYPEVPGDLALSWSRPTGGPITSPLTISNQSNVSVTASTASGCNWMVLDQRAGRLNFCKRMRPGIEVQSPLIDQFDQPYVGEETTFLGWTAGGTIRWRMPVIGVPTSAKFAAPSVVLVATTQGQVLLLNTQDATFAAPEVRLRPDADPDNALAGFGDCVTSGPRCGIPAPPAVDVEAQRAYLNFWPQGAIASQLRALDYREADGKRQVREAWHAEIPGGVIGPAAVSADGKTVYAFSRIGRLVALYADTGRPKWTYDYGDPGFATLTATPDGHLIPAGPLGGPLRMLVDRGDRAEQVWSRDDLKTAGLSTLTAAGTAWAVVRAGDGLALTEISAAEGKTLRTLPLPDARGFTTGIAVSPKGQIAVATNIGKVYFFDSKEQIGR
ncbi:PQQ-binding-like beta-propeller repeat protein [Gordonia defluvii]|jgi:outer membrane protein assembly factor BamB|uniref:PQQ-binding-like beta-propeller repeat protein n=1 Tax=Gordonia defluvii TaxID=283718 RepID=A0ABP6LB17_9ACTN